MIKKISFILIALLVLGVVTGVFAKGPDNVQSQFYKLTAEQTTRTLITVPNWAYWMQYNGLAGIDPYTDDSGGFYPRGPVAVIFQDGFIWGGIVNQSHFGDLPDDSIRVGGQTYVTGVVPGWIETNGTSTTGPTAIVAEGNVTVRIYRIRPDYQNLSADQAEVIREAALENGIDINEVTTAQAQQIITNYTDDWNDWPVDKGAPFYDVNGNGTYELGTEVDLNGNGTIERGEREEPGIGGADQVIWFAANDLSPGASSNLYGSPPIGVEEQVTAWGYNQPGATLGQMFFKRYRLINKSGFPIKEMYLSQWSDPDVGNHTDDLAGCDIPRSIGFAYSGALTDDQYQAVGLPPACVGYDFFQGPIVDGIAGQDLNNNGVDDSTEYAIFDLKSVGPSKINLPMTSFSFFAAGSAISDPDLGEYAGTLQWYNMLKGNVPTDDIPNPTQYTVGSGPEAGQPTLYPLSGDPFRDPGGAAGDVDANGTNQGPGDRRIVMASGPFDMDPWVDNNSNGLADYGEPGVQEMVVSVIGGIVAQAGGTNRNAVEQMKLNDDFSQFIYNNLFQGIPTPPRKPVVTVTPLENELAFEWGSDVAAVAETEADDPVLGFNFEGYNIYQLPNINATKAQAIKVVTFDLANLITIIRARQFVAEYGDILEVPVQSGTDNGIQRHYVVDKDWIKDRPLYAGNSYFFAVTAYNYNSDPTVPEPTLESALEVIEVIPQSEMPGEQYLHEPDEMLEVVHAAGVSDGRIEVTVVDPAAVTGDSYEVTFTEDTDTTSATYGEILWTLTNTTTGSIVQLPNGDLVANQVQEVDIDAIRTQPIFDGITVRVQGPPFTYAGATAGDGIVEIAWAGTPLTEDEWDGAGTPFGGNKVWHSLNSTADYYISAGGGAGTIDRLLRYATYAVPRDFELRFTDGPNWGVQGFSTGKVMSVPFELWDTGIATRDDPADDVRMIPYIYENVSDIFEFQMSGDTDPYFGFPASDWVYWMDPITPTAYEDNFAPEAASVGAGGDHPNTDPDGNFWADMHGGFVYPIGRLIICDYAGDETPPPSGTTVRMNTTKPIAVEDVYTFDTRGVAASTDLEKEAADKVNVFPNPYYAFNPSEPNRFTRFVTFNHLPEKAVIRIFSLSGIQVVKLEKDDPTTQFLRWDLRNDASLPVASGLYICHVDMPDIGKTKVLKLFVVQAEEFLEFF